jgi:hypothetical protein
VAAAAGRLGEQAVAGLGEDAGLAGQRMRAPVDAALALESVSAKGSRTAAGKPIWRPTTAIAGHGDLGPRKELELAQLAVAARVGATAAGARPQGMPHHANRQTALEELGREAGAAEG